MYPWVFCSADLLAAQGALSQSCLNVDLDVRGAGVCCILHWQRHSLILTHHFVGLLDWYKQCTMSVGLDFDPRSLYPNLDSVLNSLKWQAYQDIISPFDHNIWNHQPTAFSKRVESAYIRPKDAVLPAFIWQHRITQCWRHVQRRYLLFYFFCICNRYLSDPAGERFVHSNKEAINTIKTNP